MRKVAQVKANMWKNNIADLDGSKILNITDSVNSVDDFSRYMYSIVEKDGSVHLWLHSNPNTRVVFEYIAPILRSAFNERQREYFIKYGSILCGKHRIACCYRFGTKKHIKMYNLHVVVE